MQNGRNYQDGFETQVPRTRPLVATPLFWGYVLGGIVLALVVASQLGWVRKISARSISVGHFDLNDRPAPTDPKAPPPAAQSSYAQAPLTPQSQDVQVTPKPPVRVFEPPPRAPQAPSPDMPGGAARVVPQPAATPDLEQKAPPVVHPVPDVQKPAEPTDSADPAPQTSSPPAASPNQAQ